MPKGRGFLRAFDDMRQHTIQLHRDRDSNQQCKTLAHELAHHFGVLETPLADRAWEECAAESTAFLFSALIGLDTRDYSAAYVTNWSHADPAMIPRLIQTVQHRLTALTALIPALAENSQPAIPA